MNRTRTTHVQVMNTVLEVLYRDGHNYKKARDLIFSGEITDAERAAVTGHLDEGEFFVPMQLGIAHFGTLTTWSFPTDIDHPYHELQAIGLTEAEPNQDETVHEFVARFVATTWDDTWDVEAVA